jgi:hypothetical protein
MTDDQLDRTVRDADPYRPDALGHLDDASEALLTEIMAQPALALVSKRRGVFWQVAGAAATVAVLAGVFAVSTVLRDRPEEHRAGPVTPTASAPAPEATKATDPKPRLLINQPGWKVTTVSGFADLTGTIRLENGSRFIEMDYYPADQYDFYYADRLPDGKPQSLNVNGMPATMFGSGGADHFSVMLKPRAGTFVEMGGGGWTRKTWDQFLAHIEPVDVHTWLAAMPPEIITPAKAASAGASVLANVPLPPGFNLASLKDLGTNDAYQFGAGATGRVGCGWIAEWKRAKQAGDHAAQLRAEAALRGSHQWKELKRLQDQGGWSDVFWGIADAVAAGHLPDGYASGLGCN